MSKSVRERAKSVIQDFRADTSATKGADDAAVSRCLVFCRVRPAKPQDFEDGAFKMVSVQNKRVIVKDERNYDFDGTFSETCRQEDIFNDVATPCLQHAFGGFCSALMCYGQTGTGKSFTMCCTKPGIEGIIPRSAEYIFSRILSDTNRTFTVTGQFIQIYRDQLGDLMTTGGRDKVDIRFEKDDGVSLPGCSQHLLNSKDDFMKFYAEGDQRRVVTATAMNPESSRGHTAMVISIVSSAIGDEGSTTKGKITFIDLAGYERFSKTGISNANPIMKDEAKTINASLLALGHVVSALSNGDKHIPWRNSKLTRLLQDSIGGRSRTSIILTVGPSSDHLHETANSLQFGSRAMAVKVEAKMSVSVDYEKLAVKLQGMLDEKNERINLLEVQVAARDAERAELSGRHQRDDEVLHQNYHIALQNLKESGASAEKIVRFTEMYEVEAEILREQQKEEIEYQEEQHNLTIVQLASEQQRNETLKRTEMRLAQEKIMEEFERKLSDAREGTNEDLVNAVRQLAEKDTVLASRASEIARLHEHIAGLGEQVIELGGRAQQPESLSDTFLDISQVEEIQQRAEREIKRQHVQIVELRAQLDKMNTLCTDRFTEICDLKEEQGKLSSSDDQAVNREVDVEAMESIRVELQAELENVSSERDELQAQVKKLEVENSKLKSGDGPTTRRRGYTRKEPLNSSFTTASLQASFVAPMGNMEKFSVTEERNAGAAYIEELTAALKTASLEVPEPSEKVRLTSDISDLKLILLNQTKELDSVVNLTQKQQREIGKLEAQVSSYELELVEIVETYRLSRVASTAVCRDTLPIDEYMNVLRCLREEVTALSSELIRRGDKARGLLKEECSETSCLETLLRERDEEVLMKDEMILTRTAASNFLARMFSKLQKQVEVAGLAPVCELPQDILATLDADSSEREEEVQERQLILENDLRQQKEDKERMKKILSSLHNERMEESQAFEHSKDELERKLKQTEEAARQLEEREKAFNVEFEQIVSEKQEQDDKVKEMEEELKRATRQMMETQARMLEEKETGFFGVFKKKMGK